MHSLRFGEEIAEFILKNIKAFPQIDNFYNQRFEYFVNIFPLSCYKEMESLKIFHFYKFYTTILMSIEKLNNPNLPTIISDSFLRTYSLSRIVRINEENRNRAKVAIIRKIRQIKQQNKQKKEFRQISNVQTKRTQKETNIKSLKDELSMIDDVQIVDKPQMIRKGSKKQYRKDIDKMQSSTKNLRKSYNGNLEKDQFEHRKIQQNPQHKSSTGYFFRQNSAIDKYSSRRQPKAELRMTNLQFDRSSCKLKKSKKNCLIDDSQLDEIQTPLSKVLNNFNRLKLMMNTKSSENIMKHFYKRSLQNCTLEDIKFLIKIQNQKEDDDQMREGGEAVPMKFGKTSYVRRSFGDGERMVDSSKAQEKSVWRNEVLKKTCTTQQGQRNQAQKSQRLQPQRQTALFRQSKHSTMDCRHRNKRQEKQNQQTQQMLNKMAEGSAQIEKGLFFCYKDRQFPMGENKFNGVYRKWQQECLKKKSRMEKRGCVRMGDEEVRGRTIDVNESDNMTFHEQQEINNKMSQTSLQANHLTSKEEFQPSETIQL